MAIHCVVFAHTMVAHGLIYGTPWYADSKQDILYNIHTHDSFLDATTIRKFYTASLCLLI